MTAVAHLSTGLLLKGKFRQAPLPLLLFAAALPDLVWAMLNLAPHPGQQPLEVVRLAGPFRTIGDPQFLLQPWSHSLLMTAGLGVLMAGLTYVAYRRTAVAVPVFWAVLGHWLLDYLVHDADLTLWPAREATRVGPPFVLDLLAPERGLSATSPLMAFALQTAVVFLGAAVFLRAYPSVTARGRLWFVLWALLLAASALPLFLDGALTGHISSTTGLIWGSVAEMAVLGMAMYLMARRLVGRGAVVSNPLAEAKETAVAFIRRLLATAGALAFLLAAIYLGQSMVDAQRAPGVGFGSVALAAVYFLVGRRFVMGNPSTLWAGIFLPLVAAPVVRIVWPGASLGLVLLATALEVGLGLLSMRLVRTLTKGDFLL